jgi:hypothetical protein
VLAAIIANNCLNCYVEIYSESLGRQSIFMKFTDSLPSFPTGIKFHYYVIASSATAVVATEVLMGACLAGLCRTSIGRVG